MNVEFRYNNGQTLTRMMTMPPRVGEEVLLDGHAYEVEAVAYDVGRPGVVGLVALILPGPNKPAPQEMAPPPPARAGSAPATPRPTPDPFTGELADEPVDEAEYEGRLSERPPGWDG